MIKDSNIIIEGPHSKPIVLDLIYEPSEEALPVVVFCHGYKGFKDWGAWHLMSEYLAENGLCLVKFNFSYNGGTVEQPIDFPDLDAFGNNNYTFELDDLEVVLNWIENDLSQKIKLNLNDLTLIGHSRGGGIATLKASEDQRISKLISLAGVSDFRSRFNIGSEEFKQWERSGVKYVLNGRTKQKMPHYFQFYEDFTKNEERLSIERAAKSIAIPHLIIHGDQDTSVKLEEAFAIHEWNKKSILKIIEGTNHVFDSSHPWINKELPNAMKEICQLMTDFIKTNPYE